MQTLRFITLMIHIAGGAVALLTGLIPMIVQKGGRLHRRAGWVYTFAMADVFITSLMLSTIIPILTGKPIVLYLLFIGVFSGYFVFTGLRSLRFRRPGMPAELPLLDKACTVFLLLFSLMMMFFSMFEPYTWQFDFQVIIFAFALFGLSVALRDISRFRKPYNAITDPHLYFINHLGRMLGSYIFAIGAFVVNNFHFLPPLVAWFGPGLIGGAAIAFTIKNYRRRLLTEPLVEIIR